MGSLSHLNYYWPLSYEYKWVNLSHEIMKNFLNLFLQNCLPSYIQLYNENTCDSIFIVPPMSREFSSIFTRSNEEDHKHGSPGKL